MKHLLFLLTVLEAAGAARPAFAQGCPNCPSIDFPDTSVAVTVAMTGNASTTPAATGAALYRAVVTQYSTIGLPAVLPGGSNPAWCGTSPRDAVLNARYVATATPTIPAPAWNRINYVLNHKAGSIEEVQEAIWTLLGTMTVAELNARAHLNAIAMYEDAMAYGGSFVPAAGERMGLMLRTPAPSGYQHLIIELVRCAFLGGRVWRDANANGVADPGEPGLNGVTVELLDSAGAVLDSTATAPSMPGYPFLASGTDGWYSFSGFCPGSYRVRAQPAQAALGGAQPTTPADRGVELGAGPAQANFGFAAGLPPLQVGCPQGWARMGVSYTSKLHVTGGSSAYAVTYTGALPPGLAMDAAGNVAGTAPNTAPPGAYAFTALVSASGSAPASASCSILVAQPVTVECPAATARAGVSYSGTLHPTGGSGAYAAGVTTPETFPPGLYVERGTGRVMGTPAAAGSYLFSAAAADRGALADSSPRRDCALEVAPAPEPLAVQCVSSKATRGVAYSSSFAASGGVGPYHFALAGSLPPGLTLDPTTGRVAGVPSVEGTFVFTIQAQDSNGAAASLNCGITVERGLTLLCPAPAGYAGLPYVSAIQVSGGAGPFTFGAAGLPAGLTLDPATGAITGIPAQAGSFSITAQVTDTAGQTAAVVCGIAVAVAAPGKCALSMGYWKNHTSAWPVATLTLGAQEYPLSELKALLDAPPKGDASIALAHQLIAASLNTAYGAGTNALAVAIAAADAELSARKGKLPFRVSPSSDAGRRMNVLADALEALNEAGCGVVR